MIGFQNSITLLPHYYVQCCLLSFPLNIPPMLHHLRCFSSFSVNLCLQCQIYINNNRLLWNVICMNNKTNISYSAKKKNYYMGYELII